MAFDYNKLLGRMRERQITQEALAALINNSPATLSLKLNNKARFKQAEIATICDKLEISPEDIGQYFFTLEVQKI